MYAAAAILIAHNIAFTLSQVDAEEHPPIPEPIPAKIMGGRFSPMATDKYRQKGERHNPTSWSVAKPHALHGKIRTAPHASHDPLRILLIDSQRIAAIVVDLDLTRVLFTKS
jgi:hypothetical protein